MKRRQFIQSLTAASALGVFTSRAAQAAASKSKIPVLPKVLDSGKWAPVSQQRLQAVIDELGSVSRKYNPNKRPYAVFDWDNTSIMNDTEALFMYQINTLSFAMPPEVFPRRRSARACRPATSRPISRRGRQTGRTGGCRQRPHRGLPLSVGRLCRDEGQRLA